MTKTELRIRGQLTPETLARYHELKALLGVEGNGSDNLCVQALLAKYDHPQIAVSSAVIMALIYPSDDPITETERDRRVQEQTDIAAALDLEHVTFWGLLRQALVREARLTKSHAANLDTVVLNGKVKQDLRGVQGASYAKIKQCVDGLMAENLAQDHAGDILYITQGIVTDMTGCHNTVVAQYFREHAPMLKAHHQSFGIGSHKAGLAHNRLRARRLKEQAKNAEHYHSDNIEQVDEKGQEKC